MARRGGGAAAVTAAPRAGRVLTAGTIVASIVIAVLAALALMVAVPAGRALAHAELLSITPGSGEVLERAPAEVVLRFSEPVSLSGGSVRVLDDRAETVSEPPAVRGEVITVGLPAALPDGTYTVVYEVISADSHRITGASVFHVGAPSAGGGAVGAPGGGAGWGVRAAAAGLTTLAYAGALVAAGVLVLAADSFRPRALLARPGPAGDRLAHRWDATTVRAAVVGALGLLAATPWRIARLGGGVGALGDDDLIRSSLRGPIGLSLAVTVVALLALAAALDRRAPRGIGLLCALGALVGFTLEGHTRAERPLLMIVTDVAHLAAAAVWLGGVVGLVVAFRTGVEPDRLAGIVSRFSRRAVAAVVVVSAAGAVLAWVILPGFGQVTSTGWGLALLTKVILVAVVVAIGAYNHRRLVPVLAGGDPPDRAAPRLARLVLVEAVLLLVVVGVTSVLVTRSPVASGGPLPAAGGPTGTAVPPAPAPGDTATVIVLLSDGGMATVSLEPGRVGSNEMTVVLHDAEHRVVDPVEDPTVEFTQVDLDVGPLAADVEPVAVGRYRATLDLSFAGPWEVRVRVRTGDFDSAAGVATIDVAG